MAKFVLVLNADYIPLQVMPWQDAVSVVFDERCSVLEEYEDFPLHAGRGKFIMNCPAVILIHEFVRPRGEIRFSKYNVFQRDDYTCQYCLDDQSSVTLDHVIPRIKGGVSRWENVVTCCERCNLQKGHKSLKEMASHKCWNGEQFTLKSLPVKPSKAGRWNGARFIRYVGKSNICWLKYLPGWETTARRLGREWLIEAFSDKYPNE